MDARHAVQNLIREVTGTDVLIVPSFTELLYGFVKTPWLGTFWTLSCGRVLKQEQARGPTADDCRTDRNLPQLNAGSPAEGPIRL